MKTTSEVPARPSSLQGLPPILPDGPIRALVLGSFPSAASLESGQYYGHAQNRFWRVLAHCRVIEDPAAPYAERVAVDQPPAAALERARVPLGGARRTRYVPGAVPYP